MIPAVAYRQKLTSGGSGVTILRYDTKQPGIASISKTSGEAIPAANVPADLYPVEAFQEAIRLTAGMPYTKRGGVVLKKKKVEACLPDPKDETPEEAAEEVVVDSAEYEKLVRAYTDKSGKGTIHLNQKGTRAAPRSFLISVRHLDPHSLEYIQCSTAFRYYI